MSDEKDKLTNEKEQQVSPYITEKIRKKRFSPLRFFIQVVTGLFLAALFGVTASIAFVKVLPLVRQIDNPEESSPVSMVELPTYSQENKETEGHEQETESEQPSSLDENQLGFSDMQKTWIKNLISTIVGNYKLNTDDIHSEDKALHGVYEKAGNSIATVKGYRDESKKELLWSVPGVVFYEKKDTNELLILTGAGGITDKAAIEILLPGQYKITLNGVYRGWDHVYGLVVFSVSTTSLSLEELESIKVMNTGNSYQVKECDTVMFVGNPYPLEGSVAVGRVVKVLENQAALDSYYRCFYTDIPLPDSASGFLVNLSGELVGIILPGFGDRSMHCGVAVGTEELKGTLNMIMNGIAPSLLGVYGRDVTRELTAAGMPEGVYVSDVLQDGPAYLAGISAGDIITSISTLEIKNVSGLTACMIDNHLPGETVIVKIMRTSPGGYKPMEISVTLGAR